MSDDQHLLREQEHAVPLIYGSEAEGAAMDFSNTPCSLMNFSMHRGGSIGEIFRDRELDASKSMINFWIVIVGCSN